MLRFAVIGLGPMGLAMAKNIQNSGKAEVVAFCDVSTAALEAARSSFSENYGLSVKCCLSAEELHTFGKYDAAVVALNPFLQPQVAIEEMENGKHVLCQVPVAFDLEHCRQLIETVKKTGMIFASAEQTRNWQFIKEWRRMHRAGELGKVIFAEGAYLHYCKEWDLFHKKSDGTPVVTNDPSFFKNPDVVPGWRYQMFSHPILYLPHTISPLLSVLGSRITKVSCMGNKNESYGFPGFPFRDMETAIMMTEQDTVVQVKAGFTTPHGFRSGTGAHWYQLKGTKATVEWSRKEGDLPLHFTPSDGWKQAAWTLTDPDVGEEIAESGHGGTDLIPILDFIDAVKNARPPELDVYRSVEIAAPAIVAAQSSDLGGKTLEVPDFGRI